MYDEMSYFQYSHGFDKFQIVISVLDICSLREQYFSHFFDADLNVSKSFCKEKPVVM